MGRPKQLLDWKSDTLLTHTVKAALAAQTSRVLVVLGSNAEAHRRELEGLDVAVVVNPDWETGMGSSIKAGIAAVETDAAIDGALFLVCDQPHVSSAHLDKMISKFGAGHPIVSSTYGGTNGVPVLFGRNHFSELLAIGDAEGAKEVVARNKGIVAGIAFPQGSIDIDTPDDYQRALKS